jgi:hypothetical protein
MIGYRRYYWSDILFINGKTGTPTWMIQVHHKDKNRDNNNPDNLYLCRFDFHYKTFHPERWNWLKNNIKFTSWNKGLTKETDERVKKYSENVSKTRLDKIASNEITFEHMIGKNHHNYGGLSEEYKQKIFKTCSDGRKKGENHPGAKLTELDVKQIKRALNDSISPKALSIVFNVGKSTIIKIKNGNNWSHVVI